MVGAAAVVWYVHMPPVLCGEVRVAHSRLRRPDGALADVWTAAAPTACGQSAESQVTSGARRIDAREGGQSKM